MRKLILLTTLTFLTLKSFSQTVTVTNIDTIVPLKVPIAKLVIKDLIVGDAAKAEILDLNKVITLKDQQIGLYKEKDSLKSKQIVNLEFVISKQNDQFALERQKSESLLKELKGQRRKTFLYKVGTFVGIVATSALLLK
jgi:hypothetical protein